MQDGRYFAAVCLLLAVLSIPVADSSSAEASEALYKRDIPHLSHDLENSIFLPSGTFWKPKLNSLLTALMVNVSLLLQMHGHFTTHKLMRLKLLYKCSPNETNYKIIYLWHSSSAGKSNTFCQNIRPFKVQNRRGQPLRYHITLIDQSGIGFDQAMTHYLEFKVLFDFHEGETESGSLFVFNVDSLIRRYQSPIRYDSPNTNDGVVLTNILTDEAIQFVVTLNNTKAEPVFSIQFLTTNFINSLKTASLIIRSSLSISLLIRGNKLCSHSLDNGDSDVVFSSGDADKKITVQAATKYFGYIDLFNGILVTTERGLESAKSYLRSRFTTTPISACLLISLNWPVWNYRLMATISDSLNVSEFSTTGVAPSDSCDVKGGSGAEVWLTLVTGMQGVVLPNRLICSLRVNEIATVYYNDKECINNAIGSPGKWQRCNWYSVYETGNHIRFEETVQLDHSGRYRFSNRGRDFTYHITVLTLPMFNTIYHDGAVYLESKYNGPRAILKCTVHHDGWKYVRLRPIFRVFWLFKDLKWTDLTIDQFSTQVLKQRPGSIRVKRVEVSLPNLPTNTRWHSTRLTIILPSATIKWRSYQLLFFCEATVATSDAQVMGLQHYSTRSSVFLRYASTWRELQQYSEANRVTAEWGSLMSCVFVNFIVILFS